jgi:hypothetical protein
LTDSGLRGAPGGPAAGSSRRVLIFLGGAGLLTVSLIGYTLTHRRPGIPADADHAVTDPARCLDCHGRGQRRARGPNHPLNDQCFNCHERR